VLEAPLSHRRDTPRLAPRQPVPQSQSAGETGRTPNAGASNLPPDLSALIRSPRNSVMNQKSLALRNPESLRLPAFLSSPSDRHQARPSAGLRPEPAHRHTAPSAFAPPATLIADPRRDFPHKTAPFDLPRRAPRLRPTRECKQPGPSGTGLSTFLWDVRHFNDPTCNIYTRAPLAYHPKAKDPGFLRP
jgi:hypothetical protein